MKTASIIIITVIAAITGCTSNLETQTKHIKPSDNYQNKKLLLSSESSTKHLKEYDLIKCVAGLGATWEKLSEKDKNEINQYLLISLGLSSTGTIELFGSYNTISSPDFAKHNDQVLHFIQKDLFGDRLFWSCLLNLTNGKAKVLYDCNDDKLNKATFTQWRTAKENKE